MPLKYLDPTIDIIFKLLLLRNQNLLRDMIEAVLDLRIPIATLEVLNPEMPGDFELPNLHLADSGRQVKLDRWARFLRAESPEAIELLAQEDAIMTSARDALSKLSMDPKARRLAEERETAGLMHKYLLKASYKDGLKEGRAEGIMEGRAVPGVPMRVRHQQRCLAFP